MYRVYFDVTSSIFWIFENRVPAPTFSHLGFIGDIIGDAIAVSFVAFATSYAMAKILAERDKEEVNANQVNLQIY